jgi:NADPH:quinone reductase
MRAWRFHEFGAIENLGLEDAPMPARSDGEVLLRVLCASLNPADRYMVAGQYPRPAPRPFSVGRDCCGEVREAAPDCEFSPGDRVVLLSSDVGVSRTGTLAEYVSVPESCLAPLPPAWTPEEGAAAPLVFLTAWQGLVDRGQLMAGQTVLIMGASGGVGTAAIILAKARGARVVALSRGTAKHDGLKALGADIVLDSTLEGLGSRIKEAMDGARVDLVLDNLGGDYLGAGLRAVGYGGRIIVVGLLAGFEARVTLGLMIHKCVQIQGMSVNAYDPSEARRAWEALVQTLDNCGMRPPIQERLGFHDVQKGFETLAAGPLGKVCIMGLEEA